MEASSKYFCNTKCRYYPCHSGAERETDFNCLFCYCPLYPFDDCPGTFEMSTGKGCQELHGLSLAPCAGALQ